MIALGIILVSAWIAVAIQPDLIAIYWDVLEWHNPSVSGLVEASQCAQSLARERAGL